MYLRPIFAHRRSRRALSGTALRGYTLVEILVALTLTLILMTTVVTVFGRVGTSMRNARRALEQFDRLRSTVQQLNIDFNGITARLDGRPGRPEEGLGYFELIKGSYLLANSDGPDSSNPSPYYAINASFPKTDPRHFDRTVGERGDILSFTSRNSSKPFVGRYGYYRDSNGNPLSPQTIQSDVAEVCWYLRGNRLHRRVLLIVPGAAAEIAGAVNRYGNDPKQLFNLYNDYDLSVRLTKDPKGNITVTPNSLADLVKRENRFGHDTNTFPFEVRQWGKYGLPTLAECTSKTFMTNWTAGSTPAPPSVSLAMTAGTVDLWDNSPAQSNPLSLSASASINVSDQALTNLQNDGLRVSDDVVLTNVISFDVKVWEPAANGGAGGYIDLGSDENGNKASALNPLSLSTFLTAKKGPTYYRFTNGGIVESGLSSSSPKSACVYDSGCFSYANEIGSGRSAVANGQATNGMDDDGTGVVDAMVEYTVNNATGPLKGMAPGISPYPMPLRGIQVTIRCFEPDSKQIREITIEHDFLPK
jgi:type II secretory pathway component PulJ